MIEKLIPTLKGFDDKPQMPTATEFLDKINELVDAVNTIQKEREAERFEIQEWIGILGAVRKSVNIHEKQIDELQKHTDRLSCAILDLATPNGENKALESIKAEPADPYAEQRKWIGRVCKFWNIDKDNATYGILEEVATNWVCRFKAKDDPYLWDHCEPVKPDDDIIYKGE